MHIDLVKLNHLLTIARTRSFSRAAEELSITQPALSRSVASIEQRYGFRIFERSRTGVTPTPVGARVLADAQELVRSAHTLEHNMRLYSRGEAGSVAFGMGPLTASLILPKLGAHMLAARPKLAMRCSIKFADVLLSELLNDRIEMMFSPTGQIPSLPQIAIEPVGSHTLTMIVRSGHPLTKKKKATTADAAAYPIACATDLQLKNLSGQTGALICDNYEILRKVVLGGDSVWLSCAQMLVDDLAAGRLTEVSLVDRPPRRVQVGMICLKGRTSSPAASAITAYVKTLLAAS